MLIHEGTAGEFIESFYRGLSGGSVAVLILSVRREEATLIEQLTRAVAQVDVALGADVDFFVFHPGSREVIEVPHTQSWMHSDTVPTFFAAERVEAGRRFEPRAPERLRDYMRNAVNSDEKRYFLDRIRWNIADETVGIVPDLCRYLGIGLDELPCICAIFRDSRTVVTRPVADRLSFDTFLLAARELNREVNAANARAHLAEYGIEQLARDVAAVKAHEDAAAHEASMVLFWIGKLDEVCGSSLLPLATARVNAGELTVAGFDDLLVEQLGEVGPHKDRQETRNVRQYIGLWRSRRGEAPKLFQRAKVAARLANAPSAAALEALDSELRAGVEAAIARSGLTLRSPRGILSRHAPWVGKIVGVLGGIAKVAAALGAGK